MGVSPIEPIFSNGLTGIRHGMRGGMCCLSVSNLIAAIKNVICFAGC